MSSFAKRKVSGDDLFHWFGWLISALFLMNSEMAAVIAQSETLGSWSKTWRRGINHALFFIMIFKIRLKIDFAGGQVVMPASTGRRSVKVRAIFAAMLSFKMGMGVSVLRMGMGSEGEGGTQMHSVKKIDLTGETEIVVNKQTEVKSQVIIYITVQRQKARELLARHEKGVRTRTSILW